MKIMSLPETTKYLNKLVGSEKFFNDNALRKKIKRGEMKVFEMRGRKAYFLSTEIDSYISKLTGVEIGAKPDEGVGF